MHFGVGILLGAPEIQLTQEEAKEFADAAVNVAKHYDIGASAKALAWTDLAMVAGSIYGVRVMQIVGKKQTARAGGAVPPSGPVRNGLDRSQPVASGIDMSLMTPKPVGNA